MTAQRSNANDVLSGDEKLIYDILKRTGALPGHRIYPLMTLTPASSGQFPSFGRHRTNAYMSSVIRPIIREMREKLRGETIVASTFHGYWLSSDPHEVEETVLSLEARARSILSVASIMRNNLGLNQCELTV